MDESKREILIKNMVDNLPMLRKKLDISQKELADMIGVTRNTITNIECRKTNMTWNMFLSLILIFTKNKDTDKLLNILEIYTDELNELIKRPSEFENKIEL